MGGVSVIALACACYVSVSSVRLEFVARRRVAQEKKMYICCVYACTYVCSKKNGITGTYVRTRCQVRTFE